MAEPKSAAAHLGDDEPARVKKSTKKTVSGSSSSKKSSSSSSNAAVVDPSAAPSIPATTTTASANAPSVATAGPGPVMGPSHLSAAPATTTPVPKLHDVPRIPIAEPKLAPDAGSVGTGEAKPRASKKRTATPPSGPDEAATGARQPAVSNGSAPTVDAAAVAKQDADAEREKQAAAARREAKRQRAKEIEEAKRRDELAKQALEEAKQKEEARLREQRRQKELAALNANAEECQEEDEQADYDDDGFENYDDDFEDDDKPPEKNPVVKPQAKAAKAKGTSGSSNNNNSSATGDDALSPAALKKIQQAMQAESKELSTSRPSSSSSKGASAGDNNQERSKAEAKKQRSSSSIASSIAGLKQALDPRAKRVKEVLEARKFEVEKFNLFHQAPLSEQETYLSTLRRGQVRQVAVYTNDGAKSTPTQTKYPVGVDKSMHFPDDIGLDSASSTTSVAVNGRQQSASGDDYDSGANVGSTVRFFKFLESAAYACELLAESNAMAAEQELEESSKSAKKRLAVTTATKLAQQLVFPSKQLDDEAVETLLHGRSLVAMRFSPCVSNILVTCYGSHETAAMDKENASQDKDAPSALLSDKSVSCVWDVNQPHQALYVLKNEGVISSVCLSPSRELIALAGTEDGSIHVWDLRHQSYRSNSSSGDKSIYCSPTYSTCGADYKTPSQHTSTIVALDVIDRSRGTTSGSTSGGTFQFGSMDDRGIVIIWSLIEFEAGEDALMADKCVEIGGRVKMVMNTLIDTQQQYMLPKQPKCVQRSGSSSTSVLTAKASSAATGAAAASSPQALAIGPIAVVFKFFPHDPNQFVVGTRTGLVYRGHRFEKTERSQMRMQYRRKGAASAMAAVVCIDFHPFMPEYFLVGYEDGSVCAVLCVSSWEEVPFGVSVSALQWSTARPGVFFVSYSNAQVLVWDLTEQTNAPVFVHAFEALETASPVELASSLYPLVLSSETIRASRPTIALRCGDSSPFQFALMELSHELASRTKDEDRDVKALLTSIL